MLQVMEHEESPIPESLELILPQEFVSIETKEENTGIRCSRCNNSNNDNHNFCTNCGYYLKEDKKIVFQLRNKLRFEQLKKCEHQVITTRIVLFIIAAFFLSGIAFLFGSLDNKISLTIVSLILSALFFSSAIFSYYKPFTSFLTAFIVMITISIISVIAEFTDSVVLIPDLGYEAILSIYNIVIVMVVIYFILGGIQGSYKADIIKEEMYFHHGAVA